MTELREDTTDKRNRLRFLGATNTQTRRLGYLTALVEILKDSYLPREVLNKRIRRWSESNIGHLNEYKSNKGAIRTDTSADRYITLAENMGILGEINNYLRPTEYGRLVRYRKGNDNPFVLGESRLLLTYLIFAKDADYEMVSLRLVDKYKSQKEILDNSQPVLEEHLSQRRKDIDNRYRAEISNRIEGVRSWKSPKAYSEHIFIPRIHWLIDLGLVKLKDIEHAVYKLTPLGMRIMRSLTDEEGCPRINRFWCQNLLFLNWERETERENRAIWKELTDEGRQRVVATHLELAFKELRTSSHNRISANQFILYCTLKVNYHLNISCGFNDVKSSIRKIEKDKILNIDFYWSENKGSGYILRL